MRLERVSAEVITGAGGTGDGYFKRDGETSTYTLIAGLIYSIQYIKHATTPYDAGVDFIITDLHSGAIIWDQDNVNVSASKRPRVPAVDTSGVVVNFIGTTPHYRMFPLAFTAVYITVLNGGNTKTGNFELIYASELDNLGGMFI